VPYEEKDSIYFRRYKNIVYNKKVSVQEQQVIPTMKTWKTEIKIYVDKSVDKKYQKNFKNSPNILTMK
jgi:hypothetical protein